MMKSRDSSRRRFLAATAASASVLVLTRALPTGGFPESPPGDPVRTRLARLVTPVRDTLYLGLLYLRQAPHEASAEMLASRILESMALPESAMEQLNDRAFRQVTARQLQRDFVAGNTVELDGWVLSVTEGRLCALAAIGSDS